jgi:phage tail-like protein
MAKRTKKAAKTKRAAKKPAKTRLRIAGLDLRSPAEMNLNYYFARKKRLDPYKNFKFRVKFDTDYVAGVSKVSALKRTTEMVKHREGSDPSSSHKSPGRTEYDAITLERGVTHDPDFEAWANNSSKPESKVAPRNLIIDVFNEAGQKMASYKVHRAWVSDFTGAADLDANANAIMIQSIKIQHEGYERDNSVKEPP